MRNKADANLEDKVRGAIGAMLETTVLDVDDMGDVGWMGL